MDPTAWCTARGHESEGEKVDAEWQGLHVNTTITIRAGARIQGRVRRAKRGHRPGGPKRQNPRVTPSQIRRGLSLSLFPHLMVASYDVVKPSVKTSPVKQTDIKRRRKIPPALPITRGTSL